MSAENRADKLGAQLSAYLDGELSAQERAQVEDLLEENAEARRLLRELEHTSRLVSALPRHGAPPSLVEDLQLQLERSELLGDSEDEVSEPPVRRGSFKAVLALAAMVVIVVGGTWMVAQLGERGPGGAGTQLAQNELDTEEPGAAASTEAKHAMTAKRAPDRREKGPVVAEAEPAATAPQRDQRSFAQKLQEGVTVAQAASDHWFAAEPLHLSVAVDSEDQRQELLQKLAIYCGARRVPDLGRRLTTGGDTPGVVNSFYLPGAPGVNFPETTSRQVLLRVPVGQARELVGTFERSSKPGVEVAFKAGGGFEARGWEKAGAALALLDPTEPEMEVVALNVPAKSGKGTRGGSPLEQFVEGMKKSLSRPPQENQERAAEETPAAAAAAGATTEPARHVDEEQADDGSAREQATPQDAQEAASPDAEDRREPTEADSLVQQRLAAAEAARRARLKPAAERAAGAEAEVATGLQVIEPTYVELVIELTVKGKPTTTPPSGNSTDSTAGSSKSTSS